MRTRAETRSADGPRGVPEAALPPNRRRGSALAAPPAELAAPASRPASAPRERNRSEPRCGSRQSVARAPRRESVLSAVATERRLVPKRRADALSPARAPSQLAEQKRSRAEGALTRGAIARRCWFETLPDDLLALKVMTHFDTRYLLYLRLVSRKFRSCIIHMPLVSLQPVRRRLTAHCSQAILALFPEAHQLVLAGCLAPSSTMLDGITSARSPIRRLTVQSPRPVVAQAAGPPPAARFPPPASRHTACHTPTLCRRRRARAARARAAHAATRLHHRATAPHRARSRPRPDRAQCATRRTCARST